MERLHSGVHFLKPTELTPPLLQLIDVSFSYPEREDFRLSDVDVGIDMGIRVAIVGPNGVGKSTLLNLLAGDLNPIEGEGETPIQYLLRLHPDQEGFSNQEVVRAKLERVVFTSISMSKPHILLLDEPINHLDMQSIDALADVLDEFTGGVVLVSHDSRLISCVCEDEEKSQIWEVDNGVMEKIQWNFRRVQGKTPEGNQS
ncbi:ABC transporter F family member 4-like protein [Tanacetum coccineum]